MKKFSLLMLACSFLTGTFAQIPAPVLKYDCDSVSVTNNYEVAAKIGSITAVITNGESATTYKTDAAIETDATRGAVLYLPNTVDGSNKGDAAAYYRCLRIISDASLVGSGDFTIAFWTKVKEQPYGFNPFPAVLDFDGMPSGRSFQFRNNAWWNSSKPSLRFNDGSNKDLNVNIDPATFIYDWTHYAIVKSGTTLSLYVNGTLGASNTSYNLSNDALKQLRLNGAAHGGGSLFDDIQIFQSALTASQIATLSTTEAGISVSSNNMSLNAVTRKQTFTVTGALLDNDIAITCPAGVTVSPETLAKDVVNARVTVLFPGYESVSGDLTLTSGSTIKTIPLTADYNAPVMTQKSLATAGSGVVSAGSSISIEASDDVRDIQKIDLAGLPAEYTVEVKASVDASTGRGLDVEARNADKAGFRMAVNTTDFYNFSVSNLPVGFVAEEPGTGFHVYRYAVKDGSVNIYIDDRYYTTVSLTTGMKPNNLIDNGGFELEGLSGWSNPTGWGRDNVNTRFYSGERSMSLGAWHGQTLVTQYGLPIEAGNYDFSFRYIRYSGNNYRWGLAYEQSPAADEDYIAGPWLNLNQAAWTSQSQSFTADADTDLYFSLWEWNNGSAIAVDEVELVPVEGETITPYISFGKAFGKGTADIDIEYVNYDLTGAYAPEKVYTGTSALENKDLLSIYYAGGELVVKHAEKENLKIFTLSGSMVFSAEVDGDMRLRPVLEKGVYLAQVGSLVTKFVKL